MKRSIVKRSIALILVVILAALALCGCTSDKTEPEVSEPETKVEASNETGNNENTEEVKEEEQGDGPGDTFIGDVNTPDPDGLTITTEPEEEKQQTDQMDVDLIFFMGQSNMSGAGGDASAAPSVSEEAGMEFRSVSDPTKLYPITEPFGINENNPTGLHEYPGAKKGSLVSAFVNEYHRRTGRRVIAVSVSMGATDMMTWQTEGVKNDVKSRFDTAVSYLKNNGYSIGHIYAIVLFCVPKLLHFSDICKYFAYFP